MFIIHESKMNKTNKFILTCIHQLLSLLINNNHIQSKSENHYHEIHPLFHSFSILFHIHLELSFQPQSERLYNSSMFLFVKSKHFVNNSQSQIYSLSFLLKGFYTLLINSILLTHLYYYKPLEQQPVSLQSLVVVYSTQNTFFHNLYCFLNSFFNLDFSDFFLPIVNYSENQSIEIKLIIHDK